ncbi:uncharacterized protein SAPINGB_P006325 [Magnusiomyces paraingens]|uniref:Magnesium transporter n=1 Tax=Magnusiomyces paraingens TaxID=2606893 RepID=A0A5E8C6J1_9ASCO|nr:uncharacterized protein SAPINGB_P006325 [Saprochaete ingens]VVT58670.1 unnamed protein product [Saprochaete ingens]
MSIETHQLLVGCAVGVVSAATQALGLTLQRKSHLDNDALAPELRVPAPRRALWRAGVLLFLVANIVGSSVQITTLPLIVLSPLQAVGLVFNSLCAAWVLHEPLTRQSVAGTLLVSAGALIVAAWGVVSESAKPHNLDELLRLLRRPQFLVWMGATMLLVAAVLVVISHRTNHPAVPISKSSDFIDGDDPQGIPAKQRLISGLLYAVVCGILSAHSLLMAKSAVEILVRAFVDGKSKDLRHYQSWLIVAAFLAFAVSQLVFLNRGLRLCSTAVLYPLVFCVFNVASILNSLIYFQQTAQMSALQGLMVAFGTLLILAGVLGLSWHLGWHDTLALTGPAAQAIAEAQENDPYKSNPQSPGFAACDSAATCVEPLLQPVVAPDKLPLLQHRHV